MIPDFKVLDMQSIFPSFGESVKSVTDYTLEERQRLASMLKKENFATKFSLLPLPNPGDPLYEWIEEIKITHIVYGANKRADEAWMEAMESNDPSEFRPALAHFNLMLAQINQYDADIFAAQVALESKTNVQALSTVRQKYQVADEKFHENFKSGDENSEEAMIERTARRVLEFSGLQAGSDWDMTMTSSTWYLALLPPFLQFEDYLAQNGREALPLVMARYAKEALVQFEKLYQRVGGVIPLRPGVQEFFKLTKDMGVPLSILSANFRPIVVGGLGQIPVSNRDHLVALTGLQTNSILAAHKDITAAQRIVSNPDLAQLLFLDGLSDTCSLEGPAENTAAAVFVLENTEFVNVVRSKGLPFFTFRDFHNVNETVLKIIARRDELKNERN